MSRIGAGWHVIIGVWMWAGGAGMKGHAQRTQPVGWVIAGVHADPTPPLGAPEAEFVSLCAVGPDGAEAPALSGWTLAWNGHERSLDDAPPCLVGNTVIVHRAADSAAFAGWPGLRIPLSSWPALVNGGAVVELRDSAGTVQDALHYSEADLAGGGRPVLRRNLRGCGASPNLVAWSTGMSPFLRPEPLGMGEGEFGSLDAALALDRVVPRNLGHLQWRLGMTADPVSRSRSGTTVGGEAAEVSWSSDSVVDIRWTERLMPEQGLPIIRLGPVRGCSPSAPWRFLSQAWVPRRAVGNIAPTRILADPWPDDPRFPEEFIALTNLSDHPVDPSMWDWNGGQALRRIVLAPGETRQFGPAEVQPWPGLRNGSGELEVRLPSGQPVVDVAWTPCEHSRSAFAGQGVPLARGAHPDALWHTEGKPAVQLPPMLVGYGCPRGWSGQWSEVLLHFDRPVGTMARRYARWEGLAESEWLPLIKVGTRSMAMPLPESVGGKAALEWPSSQSLEWGADTLAMEGRVDITCPRVPSVEPPALRVEEVLWHATDTTGEFVEIANLSEAPVDLAGLQFTTSPAVSPLPSEWKTGVEAETSLVIQPGEVMAFGACPRWFAWPFANHGDHHWPVETWPPLGNEEGIFRVRLPSAGWHVLDSLTWTAEQKGPWWWRAEDWAWGRFANGTLYPMPNRASPGARNGGSGMPLPCNRQESGVTVQEVRGWPEIEWHFPQGGHRLTVAVVAWPEGQLLQAHRAAQSDAQGRWIWDGLDLSGQPVRPGQVIVDVRWMEPGCVGRLRHRLGMPGYGG